MDVTIFSVVTLNSCLQCDGNYFQYNLSNRQSQTSLKSERGGLSGRWVDIFFLLNDFHERF